MSTIEPEALFTTKRDAFDTLFDHAPDKLNVVKKDGGLERPKPRPEDIVNCDLKSTLRVLYNLFTRYRNVD
ncbi:hypothetical protein INR49_005125 [Caranx melampygus]|nr:hypothetical protein INR49_005125 [Caranx melampygus]